MQGEGEGSGTALDWAFSTISPHKNYIFYVVLNALGLLAKWLYLLNSRPIYKILFAYLGGLVGLRAVIPCAGAVPRFILKGWHPTSHLP